MASDLMRIARSLLCMIERIRENGYVVLNHSPDSSAMFLRGGAIEKTFYDPRYELAELLVDLEMICSAIISGKREEDFRYDVRATLYTLSRKIRDLTGEEEGCYEN